MCIEDIRIGRSLDAQAKVVPLATAAVTPVLGENPNRVSIFFGADSAQLVTVAPAGMTPAGATGFILTTSTNGLKVRIEDWGKLVTGSWSAFTAAAGVMLAVMEASLPKQ